MDSSANSPGNLALTERPVSHECRNPACPLWAATITGGHDQDRCRFCDWQTAPVTAQDIALSTGEGDWALVDRQEVLARGREIPTRAWAVRLSVRAAGHGRDDYSLPCVCAHGQPTAVFVAADLLPSGECRYCAGAGMISLDLARRWGQKRVANETPPW